MEVIGQLHARPLYPQGRSSRYPLDMRLGGSQSRSGRGGEEKIVMNIRVNIALLKPWSPTRYISERKGVWKWFRNYVTLLALKLTFMLPEI
jgi:hypothetical protein